MAPCRESSLMRGTFACAVRAARRLLVRVSSLTPRGACQCSATVRASGRVAGKGASEQKRGGAQMSCWQAPSSVREQKRVQTQCIAPAQDVNSSRHRRSAQVVLCECGVVQRPALHDAQACRACEFERAGASKSGIVIVRRVRRPNSVLYAPVPRVYGTRGDPTFLQIGGLDGVVTTTRFLRMTSQKYTQIVHKFRKYKFKFD